MNQVHLIGNAHIDPAWLWRWTEGCSEVLSTFRSALDCMQEYGDYIFTCAGAAYYSWVESVDPAMFEEIRARVREGRWVIVGGWWVQPDCNLPCGESFARHALYSQRYFKSRFGVTAEIGYNVDSFGHNAMLPQILKQSGMRGYVYMRPSAHRQYRADAEAEKSYPFPENAFIWQSPDGSRIPAYRIPDGYGSGGFNEPAQKAQRIAHLADAQSLPQMCFYGVGNHGGGPTAQNLTALDELIKANPSGRYVFSSPNAYFSDLPTEKLKVLEDDLQNHASGCYTAVMRIKELNRRAETALLCAEKYSVMARLLGLDTDIPKLENEWRDVLFNQFHDILCGCCIKSAYDDAFCALGGAISLANQVSNRALQKIFWNTDTLKGEVPPQGKFDFRVWDSSRGVPAAVFNPHAWEINVPIRLPSNNVQAVADESGSFLPVQRVRAEFTADIGKYESIIHAHIPAMGYRVFRLYKEKKAEVPLSRSLAVTEYSLENDWTRVKLDRRTGAIVSFIDKQTRRELIGSPCRCAVMDESHCDTWAHAVFRFDKEAGIFDGAESRISENGSVRAAIEVRTRFGSSVMTQKYIMYRDRLGLFISYHVFWGEEQKMLKLCFPLSFSGAVPVSSIPYGFIKRRADGREYPMQNWVALCADGFGLGIATDSRTAYDATDSEIRITALRSPIFANHLHPRAEECLFTDQGDHFFDLYLNAVTGSTCALQHAAACMVCQPRVLMGGDHHGTLPDAASAVSCDAGNVEVTVLKPAEDKSDDLILRCHEMCGKQTAAGFRVGEVSFDAAFAPQQIRSFRISGSSVTDTDMIESE